MAIVKDALIVGLTGSFGGGCSTLRESLAESGYKPVSLSSIVRDKWQECNPGKPMEEATRSELQDVGNLLRKESGNNAILVEKALQEISSSAEEVSKLVVDSIRHPDEISLLRGKSRNTLSVAIGCSLGERWKRLEKEYEGKKLSLNDFYNDEKRDAFEDEDYGQKVQLCVDDADISLRNEEHFSPPHKRKEEIFRKAEPYIRLIHERRDLRQPTPDESMMAVAYTKGLHSTCYKRQVGAVITDENGDVLGMGCNENPSPLLSCLEEFGECYRDIYKKEIFDSIIKGTECPECGKEVCEDASMYFKCKSCNYDFAKRYIPDRGISHCTALHAEESAIISVGSRHLRGCTIYSTTYPCFSCAQKIVACGIRRVIYCEAYPDRDASMLFDRVREKYDKSIQVFNFEGVKARAYFRVFGSWRSDTEKLIEGKRR